MAITVTVHRKGGYTEKRELFTGIFFCGKETVTDPSCCLIQCFNAIKDLPGTKAEKYIKAMLCALSLSFDASPEHGSNSLNINFINLAKSEQKPLSIDNSFLKGHVLKLKDLETALNKELGSNFRDYLSQLLEKHWGPNPLDTTLVNTTLKVGLNEIFASAGNSQTVDMVINKETDPNIRKAFARLEQTISQAESGKNLLDKTLEIATWQLIKVAGSCIERKDLDVIKNIFSNNTISSAIELNESRLK